MIDRTEFFMALKCALRGAEQSESPHDHFPGVLFDFRPRVEGISKWHGLSLVGTNGQRITWVKLAIEHGLERVKFFMGRDDAHNLLKALGGEGADRATILPMGAQLMVLCGAMCGTFNPVAAYFPEKYSTIFIPRSADTQPGKTLSYRYLTEALESVAPLVDGAAFIDVHNQDHACIKAALRDGFKHILSVEIAIMPHRQVYEGAE